MADLQSKISDANRLFTDAKGLLYGIPVPTTPQQDQLKVIAIALNESIEAAGILILSVAEELHEMNSKIDSVLSDFKTDQSKGKE